MKCVAFQRPAVNAADQPIVPDASMFSPVNPFPSPAVFNYNPRGMDRLTTGITVILTCLASTGCVQRILQVESEPPGASVHINGEAAGKTPLEYPFDFYGEFEIVLRLDDHRSRRISHEASAPWYAYFPVDLVVEFLLPIFPIRDVHRVDAKLEKTGKIDEALRKDLDARVEAETSQGPGNQQTK